MHVAACMGWEHADPGHLQAALRRDVFALGFLLSLSVNVSCIIVVRLAIIARLVLVVKAWGRGGRVVASQLKTARLVREPVSYTTEQGRHVEESMYLNPRLRLPLHGLLHAVVQAVSPHLVIKGEDDISSGQRYLTAIFVVLDDCLDGDAVLGALLQLLREKFDPGVDLTGRAARRVFPGGLLSLRRAAIASVRHLG